MFRRFFLFHFILLLFFFSPGVVHHTPEPRGIVQRLPGHCEYRSGRQPSSSGSSWRRAWHQALASGAAAQVNCCFSFCIFRVFFFFIDSPLFLCSGDSFSFILFCYCYFIYFSKVFLEKPTVPPFLVVPGRSGGRSLSSGVFLVVRGCSLLSGRRSLFF